MKYSDIVDKVIQVQDSMLESAPTWCSASDREELGILTRRVVEFYCFLWDGDINDDRDLMNQCEDAFEATDSFVAVAAIYRLIGDKAKSAIAKDATSPASLKDSYISKYREFSGEVSFEERCRLLLDLFRLQIVFAGVNFN